jgi:hypothetical protein
LRFGSVLACIDSCFLRLALGGDARPINIGRIINGLFFVD